MRITEEFRKLDPCLQMQTAAVFLTIAHENGINMAKIGEITGLGQSSCSRNVAALSKFNRLNKPGLGLVKASEDPTERRRKIVTLTPKGKQVAKALQLFIDEA
jgi:DNA-binding MarR family transcriptional regulator